MKHPPKKKIAPNSIRDPTGLPVMVAVQIPHHQKNHHAIDNHITNNHAIDHHDRPPN
jgi:hypothetical protein